MKKIFAIIILVLLVAVLSGCSDKKVDELYKLPQQSEDYLQLQNKIDEIIAGGAEYAAPTAGNKRQVVQFVDIDGDGIDEVLVFFLMKSEAKPLKIYIFSQQGDIYETAAVIEGEGTSIDSVTYSDLDGDGVLEIIAGWKISSELQTLSVYSMIELQQESIMTGNYSQYLCEDLTGSGLDDLMILGFDSSESKGKVSLLTFTAPGHSEIYSAETSQGITAIDTVDFDFLRNGYSALLVQGAYDQDKVITDIFAFVDGKFSNITADENGISKKTLTTYPTSSSTAIRPMDINGDGVLEVPAPFMLQGADELASTFYVIRWYNYDEGGNEELAMTTYHNYSDGWYLDIPDDWVDRLALKRIDDVTGERGIVFTLKDTESGEAVDFMTIYTLTGDNKEDRADINGRIVLYSNSEIIYSAEILSDISGSLSESEITQHFAVITTAWD